MNPYRKRHQTLTPDMRVTWRTWAAWGNPKWWTETALRVRISMRPWPRSPVRSSSGTRRQARRFKRSSRVGWLALTTNRSWAWLLVTRNPGGLGVGLEGVGGDHDVGEVQWGQQRGERGHLLGRAADARVGPPPRGWCGPSPPAGAPGGRRRRVGGRHPASCRRP